jgi:hypothetical protein
MQNDDPRPLFSRVPDQAVGPLYALLRERCEGGADYTPPAPGSDPMQELRQRLKQMTPAQLEVEYKALRRQLAGTPVTRGAADPLRALGIGAGGIRGGSVERGPTYEQLFAERARGFGR